MNYDEFLQKKARVIPCSGFDFSIERMNEHMYDWQKDIVLWAIRKGKAALFEDCGLGKTLQQLEWCRIVALRTRKPTLILAPLAVSMQTKREGYKFGYEVNICRTQADVLPGINIANYEMIGHFDLSQFGGVALDESSILKHYSSKSEPAGVMRVKGGIYENWTDRRRRTQRLPEFGADENISVAQGAGR